jgi:hypothetical protein
MGLLELPSLVEGHNNSNLFLCLRASEPSKETTSTAQELHLPRAKLFRHQSAIEKKRCE